MVVAYQVERQHVEAESASAARRVGARLHAGDLNDAILASDHRLLQIVQDGRVLAASPALRGRPPIASFQPTGTDTRMDRDVTSRGERLSVVAYWVPTDEGPVVVYAADDAVPPYVFWWLPPALFGAAMVFTAGIAAGTWTLVGRALRPVEAIRTEMEEITASDLNRRVPVPERGEEIIRLADTMNDALARLQRSAEQQRQFTSDASHDLRSPLTGIRVELETALLAPDDTDWPSTATRVLGGVDRLHAIIQDLLELASLDAGQALGSAAVDMADMVTGELERRPRRTPVTTRLEAGVVVLGDRLRLARVLTNLLDNAERHTRSSIEVTVRREGADAVLEVVDDGDGIAESDREAIFRRFTRLDAARHRDAGGTGLGLAIAREIAGRHGGTLVVGDSEKGARFVLRLPRADEYRSRTTGQTAH
jgi:signal transduction histidine kinase